VDVKKCFKTFNIGDYVMILICPEWFPRKAEIVKKLHAHSAGPFQILKKLGDNTYIINLSESFGINSTFNIEDLVDYKSPDFNPSNPLVDESSHEPISEILRDPPFHHFQIYYLIQQVYLKTLLNIQQITRSSSHNFEVSCTFKHVDLI